MSARRCPLHGINFPQMTYVCPICKYAGIADPNTDYKDDAEPDHDWEEQVRWRIQQIKDEQQDQELIPIITANVVVNNGQMWVSGGHIYRELGHRLRESDLFQIGKQVFEVLAYQHDAREYLVRPFSTTLSDEDLRQMRESE